MFNVARRIYFSLHDCQNIETNWHEENSTDKLTAVRQIYNMMRSARHMSGFDNLAS